MTAPASLDDDLVYMLRNSHLSANSLHDLEREIADRELLENARLQHQRVHDAAVCASRNYELEEETKRLEELAKQEKRRVKLAELRIKEQAEFERLRAVPTPKPPSPPPPQVQQPQPPKETSRSIATQTPPLQQQDAGPIPPPPSTQPPSQPLPPPSQPPPPAFAPQKPGPSLFPTQSAFPQSSPQPPPQQQQAPRPMQTTSQPTSSPHIHPDADRYVQIHQELKKMRKHVLHLSSIFDDNPDPEQRKRIPESAAFRNIVGDLRRDLRAKIGQVKAAKGPGSNKKQIADIMEIMKKSLEYQTPTWDPSPFFVQVPAPVEGQPDQLPLVFLYLMNIFAKTITMQFTSEAGIKPEAADSIGTVAVNIIARPANSWRGVSFIDMLIAKFRITCPVLFGFRGNEKTEQGRARLGWWKQDGQWVSESVHNDRMTGLGAGFAAISLRDFSRVTSMKNPYPPYHYWRALACILNTPTNEVSNTQYVVLKAMIEGFEMRFLTFYGSAAKAALKVAVVDFPARAPEQNASVTSLGFLGKKIQDEFGLRLG